MGMQFPHQLELARYNQTPKDLVGPQGADDLFFMHEAMKTAPDSWAYLYVAGSAAAESGLMATHLPAEERHERINAASDAWNEAQDKFIYNHIDDGWTEAKLFSMPDRIEMQKIFCGLYHDMIDENVRQQTIERTHANLVHLAMSNLEQHNIAQQNQDYAGISTRRGLGYELGTLLTVTRLGCPSFFVIPATARADHGEFFPEHTHDVRLIHQSWGRIQSCVPYEVKPSDDSKIKNRRPERYRSAFVRGRVELLMPSNSEPLALVRYMDAELRGTISPQHLGELNEITSRILTLAEKYRQREHNALPVPA